MPSKPPAIRFLMQKSPRKHLQTGMTLGLLVGLIPAVTLIWLDFGRARGDWRMAALLLGLGLIAGAVLGFSLFGILVSQARSHEWLSLVGSVLSHEGVSVDLQKPHHAAVHEAPELVLVELAQEPGGERVWVPLPVTATAPKGWPVLSYDGPSHSWEAGYLVGSQGARELAEALMGLLAQHESLNVFRQRTRWVPSETVTAVVEHAISERLATEGEPIEEGFRQDADGEVELAGVAAIVAQAAWLDERVGATPEWLVTRELDAVTLFPVGHVEVERRGSTRLLVEARSATGEPIATTIELGHEESAAAAYAWLARARERPIAS